MRHPVEGKAESQTPVQSSRLRLDLASRRTGSIRGQRPKHYHACLLSGCKASAANGCRPLRMRLEVVNRDALLGSIVETLVDPSQQCSQEVGTHGDQRCHAKFVAVRGCGDQDVKFTQVFVHARPVVEVVCAIDGLADALDAETVDAMRSTIMRALCGCNSLALTDLPHRLNSACATHRMEADIAYSLLHDCHRLVPGLCWFDPHYVQLLESWRVARQRRSASGARVLDMDSLRAVVQHPRLAPWIDSAVLTARACAGEQLSAALEFMTSAGNTHRVSLEEFVERGSRHPSGGDASDAAHAIASTARQLPFTSAVVAVRGLHHLCDRRGLETLHDVSTESAAWKSVFEAEAFLEEPDAAKHAGMRLWAALKTQWLLRDAQFTEVCVGLQWVLEVHREIHDPRATSCGDLQRFLPLRILDDPGRPSGSNLEVETTGAVAVSSFLTQASEALASGEHQLPPAFGALVLNLKSLERELEANSMVDATRTVTVEGHDVAVHLHLQPTKQRISVVDLPAAVACHRQLTAIRSFGLREFRSWVFHGIVVYESLPRGLTAADILCNAGDVVLRAIANQGDEEASECVAFEHNLLGFMSMDHSTTAGIFSQTEHFNERLMRGTCAYCDNLVNASEKPLIIDLSLGDGSIEPHFCERCCTCFTINVRQTDVVGADRVYVNECMEAGLIFAHHLRRADSVHPQQ